MSKHFLVWAFAFCFFCKSQATENYETVIYDRHYTWTRSSQNIVAPKNGANSGEDYLDKIPGNAFSSTQTNSRLSFFPRGLSSQSIQVYVDGILLNDPADPLNRYDFSNLNWNELESVEYNPSSALSGKPGGTLFIWTPHSKIKGEDQKKSHFLQELSPPYASRTTFFSAYPVVGEESKRQYSLSLAKYYSRNQSQSLQPGVFERDSLNMIPARFSFLFKRATTEVDFHSTFSYLKESLDGGATTEDFNATQISHVGQGKVSFRQRWMQDSQFKASIQQNYSRRKYNDPSDGAGDFSYANDYRSLSTLAEVENVFTLNPHFELIPLFTFKSERLRILGDEYLGWTTQRDALWGARLYSGLKENWKLYLSARSDPSLGFTVERDVHALNGHFYLNLAQAENRATLYQKHAPIYGNPSLKDEKISTSEFGVKTQALDDFNIHSAVFQSYGVEQIEFSSSRYKYENLSTANIWGAFLSLNYVYQSWDYEQSHTFLDTRLLRRSRWGHYFKLGKFILPVLKSELSVRLNSKQKDITVPIHSTEEVTLRLLLSLKDDWRAWLKIGNLFNQKTPFIPGYYRQGTHSSLGVEHEF